MPLSEPQAPTPVAAAVEPVVIGCKRPHAEEWRLRVEPSGCLLAGTAGRLNLLTLVLRRLQWKRWGGPVARARGFSEGLVGERRPVRLVAYSPSSCDGTERYGMARVKTAGEPWRTIRLAPPCDA